jgi:hypothetical protein
MFFNMQTSTAWITESTFHFNSSQRQSKALEFTSRGRLRWTQNLWPSDKLYIFCTNLGWDPVTRPDSSGESGRVTSVRVLGLSLMFKGFIKYSPCCQLACLSKYADRLQIKHTCISVKYKTVYQGKCTCKWSIIYASSRCAHADGISVVSRTSGGL